MPIFNLYVELQDSMGRKGSKRYESAETVDFATAKTNALALVADLAALTEMRVLAYTVSERTVYTDGEDVGANKDEGLTLVVEKTDNYRSVLRVPAPIQSVRNSDGTANIAATEIAAYFANFIDGANLWSLSDGEFATTLISGSVDL